MSDQAMPLHRNRLTYARGKELRFVGHLDMQLVWERTFRRAQVPITFSQGFNPRPKFHMAAALPLGFTSNHELLDLWTLDEIDPSDLKQQLQTSSPPGLSIISVEKIQISLPALQTQVLQAEYRVHLTLDYAGNLEEAVKSLLGEETLIRTWRKKEYDLRPLIDSLAVAPPEPPLTHPSLRMTLSAREGATARPEEVVAALGIDPTTVKTERRRLILLP